MNMLRTHIPSLLSALAFLRIHFRPQKQLKGMIRCSNDKNALSGRSLECRFNSQGRTTLRPFVCKTRPLTVLHRFYRMSTTVKMSLALWCPVCGAFVDVPLLHIRITSRNWHVIKNAYFGLGILGLEI